MDAHTERSTTAACIATLLGVPAAEVPLGEDECRAWLAGRDLGLVPVGDPRGFAWAGPWIAWRPSRDGDGMRAVVMFGIPSGVLWDPAGTQAEVVRGAVLAPLDVATWSRAEVAEPTSGVVESLWLAARAEAPVAAVGVAVAIAGSGLQGDRYAAGTGTFASGRPGSALTMVDAAVLDELTAVRGAPIDHRRNVVVRGVDLNALVGRRFRLGEVVCHGRRLCEPCAHLDRLNLGGVLRPLVHRGGLRADVVAGGTVRTGDALLVGEPPAG